MIFIGLAVVSSFWLHWILTIIMIIFFFRIVKIEEDMMINEFGEEYESYIERTGRYLPRLR
jgi:protein-S-isoprenylcysteine O-methyltransferase Ste14